MGKEQHQQQQILQHQQSHEALLYRNRCCSMGVLWESARKELSFRCVFVLILSLCLLVSAIFTIFRFHSAEVPNGFDAKDEIKLAATVQAYFRLQKPVSQLLKQIERLEYDIFSEISIPHTKVAILSMHQAGSNWTNVKFGVLSDPINSTIYPVYLSVLRSSLIELFHGQSNLSLTGATFGQPSRFEILKFPGGITVIPVQYALVWQMPQILFNFTLNNSISEILDNFDELREQLEFGLHLRLYENIYVQITNVAGSTMFPPVTIQASVMPDFGILLPQRLKQLAFTITKSHAKNLGLDNVVFGRVKSVILSSYLKGTLHSTSVSPSPAPSPELGDYAEPSLPARSAPSPSFPHASSPSDNKDPCPKGHSFHSINSPAPSTVIAPPPRTHPSHSIPSPQVHPVGPPQQLPTDASPSPGASYSSNPVKGFISPSPAPSPSAMSSLPTVQAYFRLQKPASQLLKQIVRLEHEISSEINIPHTKVVILSVFQAGSNWTSVVFGVLSDPLKPAINPVYLSVLRSSLIDLFLGQSNLTLTASTFGQPSMFEILNFPGGITVIPVQYTSVWKMPQILFNFTLDCSVSEILYNFDELRDQLEVGLDLRPYENIYVQISHVAGSTVFPPVTIQASVIPDILFPPRLKQLAQTITESHAKNLGLDKSVFGRVKSLMLSSYLKGELLAASVSSSPAPSPELGDYAETSVPAPSQSFSPASSPSDHSSPRSRSHSNPLNPPVPSTVNTSPPPRSHPSHSVPTSHLHPADSPQQSPQNLSASPGVSDGSTQVKGSAFPSLAPSPSASSSSSLVAQYLYRKIWSLGFSVLIIFHLLCWPS